MANEHEPRGEKDIYIGDVVLKWVTSYKYLGIEIHSDGKMMAAMENLCIRGWKAAFKLRSALKNIAARPAVRLKLFDALVKPIICYGSEVWGALNNFQSSRSFDQFIHRLEGLPAEKFQKMFCK